MTDDDESLEVAHRESRGLYDGAELREYQGRPGAMDCFDLPSRMGDRLFYRDGTVGEVGE